MIKFNLSLDDYSPRPQTNDLYYTDKLIEKYPEIKIDLFVSSAYARLKDTNVYWLSQHAEWVNQVKALPTNYRICLHGLHHRRSTQDFPWHRKPPSNNDEWQYLGYSQAIFLGRKMLDELNKCDIKYDRVFRPPGWKISEQAVKALKDLNIDCIAGSPKYKVKSDIKWINFTWDLLSPYKGNGNIIAVGHTSTWNKNCMNEKTFRLIIEAIEAQKNIEFVHLGEF